MAYEKQRASAQRMIQKKGRAGCTLKRTGPGSTPDANKPWNTAAVADTTVDASFPALKLNPSEYVDPKGAPLALTPGATAVLYVSPLDCSRPEVGDTVTFAADRFAVVGTAHVDVDGDPILYVLHVRS